MNRYNPIWSQITDSSLWEEPDHVVKIFITMLAKQDRDHIVRGSAFNISRWAKKTEAETLEALKVLSGPDTRRLEPQPFEGRRIERVADGWLILNGAHYQDLMIKANRREYKRDKQREYRKAAKGGSKREEQFEKAYSDGDLKRADGFSDAMHDKPVEHSQNTAQSITSTVQPSAP